MNALLAHHQIEKKETKGDRYRKIGLSGIQYMFMFFRLFFIALIGIFVHLLDYPIIKEVWGYIAPRIALYFVAQYLTLLPNYIILILLFIPTKISFPIVAISSFASFFILFAI